MDKKKVGIIALAILLFVVFVIGVPLGINACYQCDTVIITTQWGASDVLSYYGTLLGAVTTVAALAVTIAFTKKQIQHDRFLERNYTKWEKIESTATKIILNISPLNVNDFGRLTGKVNVETLFAMAIHLKEYEVTVKSSLDTMKCHISPCDRLQMVAFEEQLTDCTTLFCEIARDLRRDVLKLMDIAVENQDSVPVPVLRQATNEGRGNIAKIYLAHDGPYQELLSKKREVFDRIYADIEQQAEEILQFKKRKKNNHAHA